MARRVGFEPATPWFVARYSIQLSYRRVRTVLCMPFLKIASFFLKNFSIIERLNFNRLISKEIQLFLV